MKMVDVSVTKGGCLVAVTRERTGGETEEAEETEEYAAAEEVFHRPDVEIAGGCGAEWGSLVA